MMGASLSTTRLLVVLTAVALLGGCAAGASPTTAPAPPASTSLPSAVVATPSPTGTATAAPSPTPSVVWTFDVAYESANPPRVPGELDVAAPAEDGKWPVVVMFHGAPGNNPLSDRTTLSEEARRVADLGFVVFNASWGHLSEATAAEFTYDEFAANNSQAACAVEFARSHAAEYGGDPSTMIVFGHSGGAHIGAMTVFARPEPSAACLGGTTLGPIDALVTWEGGWLLSVSVPGVLDAIDADPRILDALTPWKHLAEHRDQKVVMLVSEDPGVIFEREVGDPWAPDSWLAVRDPSGDLRRQLEANGAFADGTLDFVEVQQLLFSVLEAQGNPVTLDVMPRSTHGRLSDAGWEVFLAAFPKAAAGG
jgi:dienelactone hydrolase